MLKVIEHVPLAEKTTFGIGKSARYYVEVRSEAEIRDAIAWARSKGVNPLVLSGGSNILLPDQEIDALVIWIVSRDYSFAGTELEADAGCNLLKLILSAATENLGGWEKLAGIPGTIGGAVRGNAGAFGSEIRDFVARVRALDAESGEMREFNNDACDFSYRHSFFKVHPEWVVVRVWLNLVKSNRDASQSDIEATIQERERRHIQNVRAAGSYFVNPVAPREVREKFEKEKGVTSREGRVPAGWLIEEAGLKGARVGDAVASEQHPNYINNDGNATSDDVKKLAQRIRDAVRKKFGIELQEEAVIL